MLSKISPGSLAAARASDWFNRSTALSSPQVAQALPSYQAAVIARRHRLTPTIAALVASLGADRAALKQRANDLYETPRCATLALMRVEALPQRLWEPAAGRGAIARELAARGHDVVKTDLIAHPGADEGIIAGVDFLLEPTMPSSVGAIITNPPFKNADAFIRRGLDHFYLPVIVLLRLMALEGANRSDLVDRHLVRVWAGIERLPKFQREGWNGPRQSTETSPFAWFVFSPEERGRAPVEFRRMSWREAKA